MKAALNDGTSIFLQIAASIEDDILTGTIEEEALIPSTTQLARFYTINPATAAKGVNMLADQGIVYKKRGIGMCVKSGAREAIRANRRRDFRENELPALLREAAKLGITREELIDMIAKGEYRDE